MRIIDIGCPIISWLLTLNTTKQTFIHTGQSIVPSPVLSIRQPSAKSLGVLRSRTENWLMSLYCFRFDIVGLLQWATNRHRSAAYVTVRLSGSGSAVT